ncbi:unnamed protein product, partial [Amoebophrya sp. A120]
DNAAQSFSIRGNKNGTTTCEQQPAQERPSDNSTKAASDSFRTAAGKNENPSTLTVAGAPHQMEVDSGAMLVTMGGQKNKSALSSGRNKGSDKEKNMFSTSTSEIKYGKNTRDDKKHQEAPGHDTFQQEPDHAAGAVTLTTKLTMNNQNLLPSSDRLPAVQQQQQQQIPALGATSSNEQQQEDFFTSVMQRLKKLSNQQLEEEQHAEILKRELAAEEGRCVILRPLPVQWFVA